jgi:NAD(P)-dependent dehydrogenase (short-subunit alcohol dehydrogenase family)
MLVNFAGVRHLTELVADHMPRGGAIATITSTAGVGWEKEMDTWGPLLETESFDDARAWCEENLDLIGAAYIPSKKVATAWTMYACNDLGARGIRINCTMPGPTQTPMFPEFQEKVGADFWAQYPIPIGRFATPEDQAEALIFLNSPAASCISGVSLIVDGGTVGAASAGTISLPVPVPKSG